MTQNLPESISIAKGVTMTFLKNAEYVTRVTFTGDADCEGLFVPFHWHETHDEIMRIESGQIKIAMGSTPYKVYTPEDGEVFIPKGTPHSLMSVKGIPTVVMERTVPMDGSKELFFRNLFAIRGGPLGSLLPVMQVFYYGDGMPTFPIHIPWLEKAFVTLLGYYIAPLLGYQLKYPDLKKTS
ncbi:hypothetical protein Moror_3072 [Moniliophthora roreri MCA 2997]|uniref:Cupin 2 conserved barrel domain-containing protein n=1 Tax=Moniliophthora roreri (strain MCA 2997) TaxID=1381753 RepID=V2YAG6_MONRO|nr:hypothetical protein Moror_3072 [Moniliophthora roreri MCA 2997]